MIRTLPRAAAVALLGAALLSACTDKVPTSPGDVAAAPPPDVQMTTIPTTLTALDAGLEHSCGLTSTGNVWCWGRNAVGTLGDSTATVRSHAVLLHQPSGVSFTQVTSGANHSCALTSAGQAWCWGSNGDGRLGDSTTNLGLAPVAVKPLGGVAFTSLHAGNEHTCGLVSSGQAYCWGGGDWGQIGDNQTTFAKTPVAVQHPSGVTFTSVKAGSMHSCALDTTGQAWCWGYGGDGSMGGGFSLGDSVPVAVTHPSGVTFTSIYTEYKHTCALTSAGQAYCWGLNNGGQLGDNTTTKRYTPVAVQQPSGVTFVSLSTGSMHTCGRTSAGQTYCWGSGSSGQVGDNTFAQRKTPVAVSQPSGVTFSEVSTGGNHTCALDGSGNPYCWGKNLFYQMGDGTTTDRGAPVAVPLDHAPRVTSTTPANGATEVGVFDNVVINFSESVSVTTSSFSIVCTAGTQSYTLSGSGTSTITLNPVNALPTADTCTVTVVADQVSDTDSVDGGDHPRTDHVFTFVVANEIGVEG